MSIGIKILFIICYLTGVAVEIPFSGLTIPIRTVDLLVPLVGVFFLIARMHVQKSTCQNKLVSTYNISLFLVLIITVVGAAYSANRERALLLSTGFITGITGYNLLACVTKERARKFNEGTLLMRILGVGVVANVLHLYFAGGTGGVEGYYEYKNLLVNSFGGSNWFASLLAYCFTYELFQSGPKMGRIMWALGYLVALFITMSKGGGVVFAAALIWKIFTLKARKKAILACVAVVLGAFVGPIVSEGNFKVVDLDVVVSYMNTFDTSRFGRIELWQMAWEKFRESPLIGHGLNYVDDPHNLILRILRDYGLIFGCFIVFWILLPFAQRVKRRDSSNLVAFQNSYIILLIHSMIEPQFFSHGSFLWICLTQGIFHSEWCLELISQKRGELKRNSGKNFKSADQSNSSKAIEGIKS